MGCPLHQGPVQKRVLTVSVDGKWENAFERLVVMGARQDGSVSMEITQASQ